MVQRAGIDMNKTADKCLSAQEIVSYTNGDMAPGQRAEIDRHLEDCRLCAGAVDGVARLESKQDYLRSASSVLTRIRLRSAGAMPMAGQSARSWSARSYLAVAATIAVVAGLTAYLTRPGAGEALFQEYFEPYPSTQPIVRGADMNGRSPALVLYESRDYKGAIVAFEDGLKAEPNDAALRFYAGLCQLALGRSEDAIANLEQTRRLGVHELEAPAEWYLALAHLRSHNVGEARSRLNRILEGRGFYSNKARALLGELDRSDRHY